MLIFTGEEDLSFVKRYYTYGLFTLEGQPKTAMKHEKSQLNTRRTNWTQEEPIEQNTIFIFIKSPTSTKAVFNSNTSESTTAIPIKQLYYFLLINFHL